MNEKETGGPAFPGPYANENGNIEVLFKQHGMTLRDYFAAKAMCGYLTGDALLKDSDTSEEWIEKTARAAYQMADAMLKARGQ